MEQWRRCDALEAEPASVLSKTTLLSSKHTSSELPNQVISSNASQFPHQGLSATAETPGPIDFQQGTDNAGASIHCRALVPAESEVMARNPTYDSNAPNLGNWNSRPPRRQAANKARIDLSAAWSSLDEHGTSGSNGNGSGTEVDEPRPNQLDREGSIYDGAKARAKRIRRNDSRGLMNFGDNSSSDEYREAESPEWFGRGKRRMSLDDEMSIPGRKRKRGAPSKRVDPRLKVTKDEVEKLVEFLAEKTDWEDAARCVGAGDGKQQHRPQDEGIPQHGKLGAATGSDLGLNAPARGTRRRKTPRDEMSKAAKLSMHWKEVLGKKIVGLYKK